MSATEELRRMLDELGVEYEGGERSLRWRDRYGVMMNAFPLANGELGMEVWSCTPEQAIAATLGRGTCHDAAGKQMSFFACSACGATDERKNPRFCHGCGREVVDDG